MKKTILTIKSQLIIGFLCPILLIIIVGSISYNRAASGMVENYKSSAKTTLEMAVSCLDQALKPTVTSAINLGNDTLISNYGSGAYDSKSSQVSNISSDISASIFSSQTTDEFVHNIHIIPYGKQKIVSTENIDNSISRSSFINQLDDSASEKKVLMEQGITWGSTHPFTDARLGLDTNAYFMYCGFRLGSGTNSGILLIDIDRQSITRLLSKMDWGQNSQIIFEAPDGERLYMGSSYDMTHADFYSEALAQAKSGSPYLSEVTLDGSDFFFIMDKSAITGAALSVLIPSATITKGADSIRNITVFMVILASVIALLLGFIIIANISRGIRRSVTLLGAVSQGDLTLSTSCGAKIKQNEFGRIQHAILGTITNTRQLIESVLTTIGQVSSSSEDIISSAFRFSEATEQMSSKMADISSNIEDEAKQIMTCHTYMDDLSAHIKTVNHNTDQLTGEISKTRVVIDESLDSMQNMMEQSKSTYDITEQLKSQVESLTAKLEEITRFIDSISGIANQTRMLSLNATIEAARAGQAGAGFTVVAEQIRSLSDESARTAEDIRLLIEEVEVHTTAAKETAACAEMIARQQEESVHNTSSQFRNISSSMEQFLTAIEEVSERITEMDAKRHNVVHTMKTIYESSQQSVASGSEVKDALVIQNEYSQSLTDTAASLKQHIKELETAAASFRL